MSIHLDKFYYKKQYDCDVVLIDGLWGSGKTMFQLVISSLNNLEDAKIEEMLEYIINLQYMNKISDESAGLLIGNHLDFIMHKSLLGRCSNMRFDDDTGFKNSTNKLERILRLFRSEENNLAPKNIRNKGLVFMTHMIGCSPFFLSNLIKERLFIIEIMRHPLYLIKHVASFFARFDKTRVKTVSFDYLDNKIPWFYKNYINLIDIKDKNNYHKAVNYVYYLYREIWANIEILKESNVNIYPISFEQFTINPNLYTDEICNFLSRNRGTYTSKALRKSKLPRKYIHQGLGLNKYGWKKSKLNNEEYYLKLVDDILYEIDHKHKSFLKEIIYLYDEKYPSLLNEYSKFIK